MVQYNGMELQSIAYQCNMLFNTHNTGGTYLAVLFIKYNHA